MELTGQNTLRALHEFEKSKPRKPDRSASKEREGERIDVRSDGHMKSQKRADPAIPILITAILEEGFSTSRVVEINPPVDSAM